MRKYNIYQPYWLINYFKIVLILIQCVIKKNEDCKYLPQNDLLERRNVWQQFTNSKYNGPDVL